MGQWGDKGRGAGAGMAGEGTDCQPLCPRPCATEREGGGEWSCFKPSLAPDRVDM